jgi:zinc transporter 7
VLLHEVPHELADFAILIQSGFSKTAAIKTQFCTAVAAFVGTAVGFYLAHSYQEAEDVLVAVVSGGFLYLATANILPLTAAETPNPNGVAMAPWTQVHLHLLPTNRQNCLASF